MTTITMKIHVTARAPMITLPRTEEIKVFLIGVLVCTGVVVLSVNMLKDMVDVLNLVAADCVVEGTP